MLPVLSVRCIGGRRGGGRRLANIEAGTATPELFKLTAPAFQNDPSLTHGGRGDGTSTVALTSPGGTTSARRTSGRAHS